VEHGEGKPVTVTVAANETAVGVSVRDHGIGMDPSQAARVFDRFWRADPARARTTGGSGLGLSIAMEDTKLHHGWLQAWGRKGDGANFRLTLPLRQDGEITESPVQLEPRDATIPGAPGTIPAEQDYKNMLLLQTGAAGPAPVRPPEETP